MLGKVGLCLGLLTAAAPTVTAQSSPSVPPAIQNAFRFFVGIEGTGFDSAGNLYLVGVTGSPLPAGTTIIGAAGAPLLVIKVSPAGEKILYATAIGAPVDPPVAMAVNQDGSVLLAGRTDSSAFPTTSNGFQPTAPDGGAFLLKLDPSGKKLIYSTYLGDRFTAAMALAIDASGNTYVAGTTNGYTLPTTDGAYQRTLPGSPFCAKYGCYYQTGFVSEFDANGGLLVSTLFGAPYREESSDGTTSVISIAVDETGVIHIGGTTRSSPDFPVTPAAAYPAALLSQGTVGFLARLSPSASQLLYSTPLPNVPNAIAVDPAGNSYVASSDMTKIDLHGSIGYYLPNTGANALIVLNDGTAILGGSTRAAGFPTLGSLQPCAPNWPQTAPPGQVLDFDNATLVTLDGSGNVTFSTLLGGPGGTVLEAMALDPNGDLYIAGVTTTPAQFPGGPIIDGSAGYEFVFEFDFSAVPHASTAPIPTCLANSASLGYSLAAPGMLATLFGSNLGPAKGVQFQLDSNGRVPTEIAGVSVTVGGLPAPVLYVQSSQINFVVPQQVNGSTTNLCVNNAGTQSCIFAFVGPYSPAVFCLGTCNGAGGSYAVLNQDYTLNTPSNPAALGSVIMIFGTGFGPIDRNLPDGSIVSGPTANLTTPIEAAIPAPPLPPCNYGGPPPCPSPTPAIPLTVLFAGAAPEEVLGVDQVNVLLLGGTPVGTPGATVSTVPLAVGGASLTVAIQ